MSRLAGAAALSFLASFGCPREASAILCTVTSTSVVAFGTYNVFSGAPTDAVGSLSYQCLLYLGIDVIIISLSAGDAGSYTPRAMRSGVNTLAYNLYLDAARTKIWGNGTNGTFLYGPLSLVPDLVTVPVFGRIPALQNAKVGMYSDTIVVTTLF